MVYLFTAFLVLWSVTFGYLYILGGRQRQLSRELASLRSRRMTPAETPGNRAVPGERQPEL
jgi:CcmD family protein